MTRWLERLALRLLPEPYRLRIGEDLCREWRALRRDVRSKRGRFAEWRYMLRESGAFIALVRQARAEAPRQHRGTGLLMDLRAALRRQAAHPFRAIMRTAMLSAAFAAPLVSFAVADAVLWRPLPFANAEALVSVWERTGVPESREAARVTGSRYLDWRARASAFEGLAAFGAAGFQVETGAGVVTLRGVRVSGDFFRLLGVAPLAGRLISPADQAAGSPPVVVLSHAYWVSQFGARPVLGETLRLSGQTTTIIGVLPDIWLPAWPVNPAAIELDPSLRQIFVSMPPEATLARNRGSHLLGVIGRLRSGQTAELARQQLESLASSDQPDPHGGVVVPFRNQMVTAARGPLLILLGAALCVLLVASLNLAAIDLAAFESRATEFRVRSALGAGTRALARQLFLEVVPVVALAVAVALGAAYFALIEMESVMQSRIPFVTTPHLDVRAFGIVAGFAIASAVLMTLWPVWRVRAVGRLQSASAERVTTARPAIFRALIAGQLAGAVALVLVSTVLVQAFLEIGARAPGFDPRNVQMIELSLPRDRYATPDAIAAFERRLLERATSAPGVRGATLSHDHPFEANWLDVATLQGPSASGDARTQVQLRIVAPEYVDVMAVRVMDGRTFDPLLNAADDGQVIVNEAFVRREDASIGRKLSLSSPAGTWGDVVPGTFTIVGVIDDERFRGLEAATEPAVYVTTRQFPQRDLTLLARLEEGRAAAADLRAIVREIEPGASLNPPRALEAVEREQRAPRTWLTMLVATFASGSLALAAMGLAGLLMLLVSAREREIGIRLALGAARIEVIRSVVRETTVPLLVGAVGGVALAALASRILETQLAQTRVLAADTVAIALGVLLSAAILAAVIPARRAASIDPARAFR